MSCGVGCRYVSDPELLWLWCRLVATAQIRPLAWKPPYAMGMALQKKKKKNSPVVAKPSFREILHHFQGRMMEESHGGKNAQSVDSGPVYTSIAGPAYSGVLRRPLSTALTWE